MQATTEWLAPTLHECDDDARLMRCHRMFDAVITRGAHAVAAIEHLRTQNASVGPVVVRGDVRHDRSRAAFLVLPGAADWLVRSTRQPDGVLRVVGAGGYIAAPAVRDTDEGLALRWLHLPNRPHTFTAVLPLVGALGIAVRQQARRRAASML